MRYAPLLKTALLAWGGFSLVAAIGLGILIAYEIGPGNRTKKNLSTNHDVRFVLNQCGLGHDRIQRVVHSHVSARGFSGDYLDAFAIKISSVELSELTSKTNEPFGGWHRGDQLPDAVAQAVHFTAGWRFEWFPTEAELKSAQFYAYPSRICLRGLQTTAAELIFVRPSDQMVFYFGCKT